MKLPKERIGLRSQDTSGNRVREVRKLGLREGEMIESAVGLDDDVEDHQTKPNVIFTFISSIGLFDAQGYSYWDCKEIGSLATALQKSWSMSLFLRAENEFRPMR